MEAGLRGQVPGLLLVDRDGGAVPVDLPEGFGDEGLDGLPGAEPGVEHGVVALPQLVQEGREDLVQHRFLGIEVVVEAAGEHPGGVGDLADGGGVVALGGEDLGGYGEEFPPAFRRGRHLLLLLVRWHAPIVVPVVPVVLRRPEPPLAVPCRPTPSYACWLLTDTVSPVMYDA